MTKDEIQDAEALVRKVWSAVGSANLSSHFPAILRFAKVVRKVQVMGPPNAVEPMLTKLLREAIEFASTGGQRYRMLSREDHAFAVVDLCEMAMMD